ncbi:DUF427 domain-containing protein [Arthrobacter zhaoguopingii]|uniref:DUF427 domain-containing protein n=1 Tax=Arthrobacter zhaoguopingii TaxID=2681491 RepID=UPI001358F639|nr:DUF427 domain-containing protein [Arthrobacter zhaoguopingii]
MGVRIRDLLGRHLGELRYEPTAKRIRGMLDGQTLFDSRKALLVWEPRRVLPTYAVPVADVACELVPEAAAPAASRTEAVVELPDVATSAPVLSPTVPFRIHAGAGVALKARMPGSSVAAEAFRPDDADLRDYVVFSFDSLDAWLEEDEEIIGHPRDPYWRVDRRRSSQEVELRLDGHTLASTNRPLLVFETMLPVRYYFPADAVRVPLVPSDTRSICPYKGRARYWNVELPEQTYPDFAWTYAEPFIETADLHGLVCFFEERADLLLDGVPQPRRRTPWS